MWSVNRENFTFSVPIWMPFISFSCIIALVRTFNTMLSRSGKREHPWIVLILKEKFSFFPRVCFLFVLPVQLLWDGSVPRVRLRCKLTGFSGLFWASAFSWDKWRPNFPYACSWFWMSWSLYVWLPKEGKGGNEGGGKTQCWPFKFSGSRFSQRFKIITSDTFCQYG